MSALPSPRRATPGAVLAVLDRRRGGSMQRWRLGSSLLPPSRQAFVLAPLSALSC